MTDSIERLARWRLKLSEYEIDVVSRAGIKHQAADVLSRLPTLEEKCTPLENDLLNLAVDVTEHVRNICAIDANCEEVLSLKSERSLTNNALLS